MWGDTWAERDNNAILKGKYEVVAERVGFELSRLQWIL
jgi:hypothetical protein